MGGPPAGPAPQHCYRHTDRETYVRCTRCDRPICGDCMRPASVGFHCPEESGAAVRPMRPSGGRVVAAGQRSPVTLVVGGLCVLAYLLQGLPGIVQSIGNPFTQRFVMYNYAVAHGEWWRLLTGAFLHNGLLHIALNMIVLAVLGPPLEQLLGWRRFLALYLLSAVGGSVAVFALQSAGQAALGASGAIYGLFGAYYLIARRMRLDTSSIVATIGINLVLSVVIPGISLVGHLGGLVTGAIIGLLFGLPVLRGAARQAAALAGLAALLVVVVLVRTPALS